MEDTMKKTTKFKRILSGVLSAAMTVSAIPIVSAHAEENLEPYPYTMFAASNEEGAITINAGNFCVNGNVSTNGTITEIFLIIAVLLSLYSICYRFWHLTADEKKTRKKEIILTILIGIIILIINIIGLVLSIY